MNVKTIHAGFFLSPFGSAPRCRSSDPLPLEGNQILFIVDAVAALLNRTLFVLVSTVRKLDTYWLYFVASNANL